MQKIEFDSEPLFQEYWYTLLCSLKDPQRELNKACSAIGERFGDKSVKIKDLDEFASYFQDFLKDYLKMAEGVSVKYNNENHVLTIDIAGCKFCPANTKFKIEKKQGAVCPLGGLLRGALKNVDGKIKSRWKATEKPPGTIGICTTSYEIVIE
ncbi:MAG: hypothetical protein ACFFCD_00110 [Promethearchaeota archaeon]